MDDQEFGGTDWHIKTRLEWMNWNNLSNLSNNNIFTRFFNIEIMSPIPAGTPVGLEIPAKDVARGKISRCCNQLSEDII